jgi:hypothetical protein
MRNFSILSFFVCLFLVSCTNSVNSDSSSTTTPSSVGTLSSVSCTFNPSFLTTGTGIIRSYPNANSYVVNYRCEKDGALVSEAECRNTSDSSFSSCASEGSLTVSKSLFTGQYNLAFRGKSSSDTTFSAPVLYNFGIDLLSPFVEDSVVVVSKTHNSFSINFAVTEPTSPLPSSGKKTIQCALSDASVLPASPTWEDCSSRQFSKASLNADTDYWVFFNVVDFAENTNSTASEGIISYKIHTNTAPVVVDPGSPGLCTISSPTENTYLTGTTLRVSYSCPNNLLQNQCYLLRPGQTSSALFNCDESFYQTSFNLDGRYEFCVVDGPSGTNSCVSFNRDTVKPTSQIQNLTSTSSSVVATLKASDFDSGIDRFTCALVNNESGKVYNAAQVEKVSVDAALNDKSVPCGDLGSSVVTASFDSSVVTALGSYTFYAKAYDRVGLDSTMLVKDITVGASNGLSCQFTNPQNGTWVDNPNQAFNYSCDYNSLGTNVTFACSAVNLTRNTSQAFDCSTAAPVCVNSILDPTSVSCTWTGSFTTQLSSSFYSSGDTIQVNVQAQDKTNSSVLLSTATAQDSYKIDSSNPVISQIDVNASPNEVLLTYIASDPNPGSGLRTDGVLYNVYKVLRDGSAKGIVLSELTDFDVQISSNQLKFGSRNFNADSDYRIDITAFDNVNRSSTQSSLIFPGPNSSLAPSCSILPVAGQTYSLTDTVSTSVYLKCSNPYLNSSGVQSHTTLPYCRVTAKGLDGAVTVGSWQRCSASNFSNNVNYLYTLYNAVYLTGNVKIEAKGCDSTYTYLCGDVSSFNYQILHAGDGAWSEESIVYFGTDTQTQFKQKVCNNPVPAANGLPCAVEVDSGWFLGALSAEGYRTQFKVSETCKDAEYSYDPLQAKCVLN